MKTMKTPMRKCNGCMEMFSKKQLIRVVHTPEGNVVLDLTSKAQGRGAYVCKNIECLKKAIKTRRFERAFKCVIPPEIYAKLEMELMND